MSENTSEDSRRVVRRSGSFCVEKMSKTVGVDDGKSGKSVVEEPATKKHATNKQGRIRVSEVYYHGTRK